MRVFSQSFLYDDSWSIVSLAYFLRYPNPYAAHVISTDVIDRSTGSDGTLLTTRLILKRGALPRWFPKGIVSRPESWVIEESEVDPMGKTVRCITRNLDHVKVMQVHESTVLRSGPDGRTMQTTEARIVSGFGWGLAKRIENHGLTRFKANIQRSREGVALILGLLRQSRMQALGIGPDPDLSFSPTLSHLRQSQHSHYRVVNSPAPLTSGSDSESTQSSPSSQDSINLDTNSTRSGPWSRLKTWIYPRR